MINKLKVNNTGVYDDINGTIRTQVTPSDIKYDLENFMWVKADKEFISPNGVIFKAGESKIVLEFNMSGGKAIVTNHLGEETEYYLGNCELDLLLIKKEAYNTPISNEN